MELKFLLLGIACAFAALVSIATLVKWREIQAAKCWLPIPGTIVSSRSEAREVNIGSLGGSESEGKTELRNFPAISFSYRVNGVDHVGTRYSLRENRGNHAVQETLAQYPKGMSVTVFYDPTRPTQAVIERTLPDGTFNFMVRLSAGLVLGAATLIFTVGGVVEAIRPHLPNPQNGGAAVLLVMAAIFVSRMAWLQQQMASQAARWPTVEGQIVQSGVEAFDMHDEVDGDWYRPWRTLFWSRVIYTYAVGGVAYRGDRISFGASLIASSQRLLHFQTHRHPAASKVTVFYDGANPAQAVLETRVIGSWALWVTAAMATTGAAQLLGLV